MKANDVMHKYSMSIDDVLNVRAIYGGAVSIVPDELLDEFSDDMHCQPLDPLQPESTRRCKVQFKSLDDSDYNKAMTLFLMLGAEELKAILKTMRRKTERAHRKNRFRRILKGNANVS